MRAGTVAGVGAARQTGSDRGSRRGKKAAARAQSGRRQGGERDAQNARNARAAGRRGEDDDSLPPRLGLKECQAVLALHYRCVDKVLDVIIRFTCMYSALLIVRSHNGLSVTNKNCPAL